MKVDRQLKTFLTCVVVPFFTACSFKPASQSNFLRILLEEQHMPLAQTSLLSSEGLVANPTTSSDFNCFGVNVTGPGIPSDPDRLSECTSPNNFRGRGIGIISEGLVTRGGTIEMDVPSGLDRTIDVYGLFPTPHDCGGSSNQENSIKAYLVGSKQITLSEGTTVTIPVSYNGAEADATCTESRVQRRELIPDGTTTNGKIFKYKAGTNCAIDTGSIGLTMPPPGTGGANETEVSSYAGILTSGDSSFLVTECSNSSTNHVLLMEIAWDLSGINLFNYSSMTIEFSGKLGRNTSVCTGTGAMDGDGANATIQVVDIWRASSSSWNQIGSAISSAGGSVSQNITSSLNSYLDSNNKLWLRIRGGKTTAGGQCSVVNIDFVKLTLNP